MYRQTPAGHPAPGTQDPVSPGVGGLAGAHGRAALLKTGESLSLTSLHHHMTLQMSSVWMLCLYVSANRSDDNNMIVLMIRQWYYGIYS